MTLRELQEIVNDREPGVWQSMGLQRVGCNLVTDNNNKCLEGFLKLGMD